MFSLFNFDVGDFLPVWPCLFLFVLLGITVALLKLAGRRGSEGGRGLRSRTDTPLEQRLEPSESASNRGFPQLPTSFLPFPPSVTLGR
jgi:hypothetical protein